MMNAKFVTRYLWALSALSMVLFCPGRVTADQWFRGNTHAHTTRSDGDASPEVVAKWYHDHNYNFLLITDHNKFTDPSTVKMPKGKRDDFILIPGVEFTGARRVHATAMNVTTVPPYKYRGPSIVKVAQFGVDGTLKAGGTPIVNHPNFCWAISTEDMLSLKQVHLLELFNGHPLVHNHGDAKHPSTEAMWDELLTAGRTMFAVAADDAHHFKEMAPEKSNPGRGWIMVQAAALNADAITRAMAQGHFYSSTGVFLKTCDRGTDIYSVEVDAEKTMQEIASLPSVSGKPVADSTEGFRIEFIGPKGKVLESIKGTKGRFKINRSTPYVRAKVIFTRKHPESGFEEFYAWGQPVFTGEISGMNDSEASDIIGRRQKRDNVIKEFNDRKKETPHNDNI